MGIFNMGASLPYLMWFGVFTVFFFAAGEGVGWTWVMVAAVGYLLSVFINRWRPCPSCRGKGRKKDWIFEYATRPCASCGGSGKKLRLGSVPFGEK